VAPHVHALFVLFTAYTFMILTYRATGATIVMVLALVCVVLQRAVVRAPAFLWVFAAWVGWAGLSYALNPTADAELWDALIEHGKLILVVLVAVNALRTPTQIRRFLLFLVVSLWSFRPVRHCRTMSWVHGLRARGRAVHLRQLKRSRGDLTAGARPRIRVVGIREIAPPPAMDWLGAAPH